MPQLDLAFYPTQLFWLGVCFIILYVLMARFALPQITDALDRRQTRIDGDLETAELAQQQAEAVAREYEVTLAKARAEAQKTIQKQADDSAKKIQKKQQKFMSDLASRTLSAEDKIRKIREQAADEIPDIASELTQTLVQKLSGQKMEKTALKKAVDTASQS